MTIRLKFILIAIFLPSGRADLTASAGLRLLAVKYHGFVASIRHLQQSRLANNQDSVTLNSEETRAWSLEWRVIS